MIPSNTSGVKGPKISNKIPHQREPLVTLKVIVDSVLVNAELTTLEISLFRLELKAYATTGVKAKGIRIGEENGKI